MQRNACVHRLDLDLYSHPKEFWGKGVRTQVNFKWKILLRGGTNPWRCIKQDREPNTLPMSCSGPLTHSNAAVLLLLQQKMGVKQGEQAREPSTVKDTSLRVLTLPVAQVQRLLGLHNGAMPPLLLCMFGRFLEGHVAHCKFYGISISLGFCVCCVVLCHACCMGMWEGCSLDLY